MVLQEVLIAVLFLKYHNKFFYIGTSLSWFHSFRLNFVYKIVVSFRVPYTHSSFRKID